MTTVAATDLDARAPDAARALAWFRLVDERLDNAKRRTAFALVSGLVGAALFFEIAALVWCLAVAISFPIDRWVWNAAKQGRFTPKSLELRAWVFTQSSLVCGLGAILWFAGGDAGKILAAFFVSAGLLNALSTLKADATLLIIGLTTPLLQLTLLPLLEYAAAGEGRSVELLIPLLGPIVFGLFCLTIWKSLAAGEETRIAEHSAAMADLVRAEEEGDARARLFAMVERELRAPLQALLVAAERAADVTAATQAAPHVRAVQDAGAVLNTVLNDLQALATLQAGGLRVSPQKTDPVALVTALAEAWRPQARQKWLELFVDISPSVPAWVSVDPVRVNQVMHHLLANALRFTRQGGVRIKLDAGRGPGGEALLAFTVADTGPGMPEDRLTQLLAPGDRLGRAAARGYGLGTAICADVAEAMGGRLKGRAVCGQGVVVSLVVPVRILAEGDSLEAQSAETESQEGPRLVLVVDDNAATRRLASVFLQEAGHKIVTASHAAQALTMLAQERFDVLVTDLRMPGMDGLALARAIRAAPERYGNIAIVAFSADHEQWDEAAARAARVQRFLPKPFTPSSLLAAIAGAVAEGSGASRPAA